MFQIAHIMVLSQPDFVQSRVRRLFEHQPRKTGARGLIASLLHP